MTRDRIDRTEFTGKLAEVARTAEDPIREIGEMVLNLVSEAEASARVSPEPYERTEERVTQRNGYRERRFNTRLGTLNLKIPNTFLLVIPCSLSQGRYRLGSGAATPGFVLHEQLL